MPQAVGCGTLHSAPYISPEREPRVANCRGAEHRKTVSVHSIKPGWLNKLNAKLRDQISSMTIDVSRWKNEEADGWWPWGKAAPRRAIGNWR